MCDICHSSPCLRGCPNEDEPEVIGCCEKCKDEIYDGDEYYECDGAVYHCDCFRDAAVDILVECGSAVYRGY